MTAYASLDTHLNNQSFKINLKSFNFKNLKVNFKSSISPELESIIKNKIIQKIKRGSIDLSIDTQQFSEHSDQEFLKWLEHCRIQKLPTPSWSDYFNKNNQQIKSSHLFEKHHKEVLLWLDQVLKEFENIRLREGEKLLIFISEHLTNMNETLIKIKTFLPKLQEQKQTALKEKINSLLIEIDLNAHHDLSKECALLLEKIDVQEEVERLKIHLEHFELALYQEYKGGKYLDFLCQEIFREINTLSNKSQSTDVSHLCLSLKSNLEKIREQVQNIE